MSSKVMKTCREYALHYLSRFPTTTDHLCGRLVAKWYEADEIQTTIGFLQETWYLDDRVYAELYLKSEVIKKWKPLLRVRHKLTSKWIPTDILKEIEWELEKEMQTGMQTKIVREADLLSQKGQGYREVVKRLQGRWYFLSDIKAALPEEDDALL